MVGRGALLLAFQAKEVVDIPFASLLMIILKKGKSSNYLSVLEGVELPCYMRFSRGNQHNLCLVDVWGDDGGAGSGTACAGQLSQQKIYYLI